MSAHRHPRFGPCALLGLLLLALGCDIDSPVSLPAFGTLLVMTVTSGANLDPDGYQLVVTGPSLNVTRAMAVNDSAAFSISRSGDYTVELRDIAANCSTDSNPRVAPVSAGGQEEVRFDVSCV